LRLQALCRNLLYRQYREPTLPPWNLEPGELLRGGVERLLTAMRSQRPPAVRQFFGRVNQHTRWELNGLARRLDERPIVCPIDEQAVAEPSLSCGSSLTPNHRCVPQSIDGLLDDEREVFGLVRVQGLTHAAMRPK
jgi:RNA polymerase sigma-70 factor (ECF subfamily)